MNYHVTHLDSTIMNSCPVFSTLQLYPSTESLDNFSLKMCLFHGPEMIQNFYSNSLPCMSLGPCLFIPIWSLKPKTLNYQELISLYRIAIGFNAYLLLWKCIPPYLWSLIISLTSL